MSQPFIGEIRCVGFNFAPENWSFCNGSLLPISQYTAIFSLIGTTYGGDGVQTFGLPNLQGRVALHQGSDALGNSYVQGQLGGTEETTLTNGQIPAHSHVVNVSSVAGTSSTPTGNFVAAAPLGLGFTYGSDGSPTPMGADINPSGGSQPHSNMQPYLVVNFFFALFGIYPSQN